MKKAIILYVTILIVLIVDIYGYRVSVDVQRGTSTLTPLKIEELDDLKKDYHQSCFITSCMMMHDIYCIVTSVKSCKAPAH